MPVVLLEGEALVGSVAVGCVDVFCVDPEPVPVPLLPLSNSGLRDWPAGGREIRVTMFFFERIIFP